MASTFYGVPLGGSMAEDVTVSATTTSLPIEVEVIHDTSGINKQAVTLALKAVKAKLLESNFPAGV